MPVEHINGMVAGGWTQANGRCTSLFVEVCCPSTALRVNNPAPKFVK